MIRLEEKGQIALAITLVVLLCAAASLLGCGESTVDVDVDCCEEKPRDCDKPHDGPWDNSLNLSKAMASITRENGFETVMAWNDAGFSREAIALFRVWAPLIPEPTANKTCDPYPFTSLGLVGNLALRAGIREDFFNQVPGAIYSDWLWETDCRFTVTAARTVGPSYFDTWMVVADYDGDVFQIVTPPAQCAPTPGPGTTCPPTGGVQPFWSLALDVAATAIHANAINDGDILYGSRDIGGFFEFGGTGIYLDQDNDPIVWREEWGH